MQVNRRSLPSSSRCDDTSSLFRLGKVYCGLGLAEICSRGLAWSLEFMVLFARPSFFGPYDNDAPYCGKRKTFALVVTNSTRTIDGKAENEWVSRHRSRTKSHGGRLFRESFQAYAARRWRVPLAVCSLSSGIGCGRHCTLATSAENMSTSFPSFSRSWGALGVE